MDPVRHVGLYFGSFNPIHIGHLIIANTMLEGTDMDEVWFVISPQNPLKKRESLIHEFDRYDLVAAATNDNYRMRPCDIEFRMPKPSYTADTLAYLSDQHRDKKFSLILGSDNLKHFHKWKNHEAILEHYAIYIYPRPGAPVGELPKHPHVHLIEAPLLDISATFIRNQIANGRSVQYLVPEAALALIRTRQLF